MDPAQRVIADAELAGIIGHDDRVADQAMMADRTPDAGFGERADLFLVEDVDPLAREIMKEGNLVAEVEWCSCSQSGHQGGIGAMPPVKVIEDRVVEHIVLIIAT